jgi:deoxyribodipyrimidine photo-lyase
MSNVIYWFRQDLRLADLPALESALNAGGAVVPVYIYDESMVPGAASRWWLHHSLKALDQSLRSRGSRLILRRGGWAQQIEILRRQTDAAAIFATKLHEPAARTIDRTTQGLRLIGSAALFNPDLIHSQTGTVYSVYTPFARACLAAPKPPAPSPAPHHIPPPAVWPQSDTLSDWNLCPHAPNWASHWPEIWQPGEDGATASLATFHPIADHYAQDRDRPDRPGTSRLSPHLHWGEISPNTAWHAYPSAEAFQRELLWRDFALYLLWHRPELLTRCLRPEFDQLAWREDPAGLAAWQQGRTGVPMVDAGMRELWHTGFMHNRVRMIVASFLTKHLLIRWQQGAVWFLDTLLDADPAANATNWQWAAGCGVEAQPFFRIFNPITQGQKFDPGGDYVRRWVPELRGLPTKIIHAPWMLSPLERATLNYPPPLIDLAEGRARALSAFGAMR